MLLACSNQEILDDNAIIGIISKYSPTVPARSDETRDFVKKLIKDAKNEHKFENKDDLTAIAVR